MIKIPRSQSTTIKNMIYPEVKKGDKTFHKKNIENLKKKQSDNRIKREEKENHVPGISIYLIIAEPYKLKEFKNVESKLSKMVILIHINSLD
jgi:hypothetical protein